MFYISTLPTPVSALIHAATLVTAGVYIIARTGFLWEYSEIFRMSLTIVGALTSIMAATCGLFQNDMKRVIAYSTCSQLGYAFVRYYVSLGKRRETFINITLCRKQYSYGLLYFFNLGYPIFLF